ncbi:2Fe-2S iron-sulfur cluster-binding protein [Chryseobacterium koreense]|uniref:NADH dehydrogenase n=1 Tax=Chryseobacterium koreense CCUG 49689 TaxID=1304281 RepID=A0A0J7J3R4_9FLAO|nr:2Fe-2S iron-sulfur cluster-binding protein [Chryseobacterium koreense]KMQ72654.1 NADH dehydrogenase [Chryseobacterium koreense CCUG 49689]MBB5333054.1 NADH-quinone oxidoreductase subunit G [Chryseobacterium koreense]
MSEEVKKFKVTIDGQTTEVDPGTSILEAARQIGGKSVPPAMCYYKPLEGSGGRCRTCLVEVSKGSEADPRPMPKLVASCRTTVMDGMEIKNSTSERVLDAREGVTEFLLINHPLDCPVCDQAGECHLQDLGYVHGLEETRTEFTRRTFEPEDIGPYIKLNMNRCILCARCVLAANQLTEEREHGILFRGDHAEISTYLNKALENDFIGNVIDVCPVGALTDRTSRFASRVWFTKPMNAHCECDKCSGKAVLWMKGEEIIRVTARKDQFDEVQDWICNDCRFHKKDLKLWTVEGPRHIDRHSVISLNHYEKPENMISMLNNPDAKELSPKDEEKSRKGIDENFLLM